MVFPRHMICHPINPLDKNVVWTHNNNQFSSIIKPMKTETKRIYLSTFSDKWSEISKRNTKWRNCMLDLHDGLIGSMKISWNIYDSHFKILPLDSICLISTFYAGRPSGPHYKKCVPNWHWVASSPYNASNLIFRKQRCREKVFCPPPFVW